VIEEKLSPYGFKALGVFSIKAEDQVPVKGGVSAVLVGNYGGEMFDRYAADRDPLTQTMDEWTEQVMEPIAKDLNATALYPFSKPHLPFQKWARRAHAGRQSPLGLNIHPVYGMWHGYRAFLVFDHVVDLNIVPGEEHPCFGCEDTPCLTACPVEAFDGVQYDVDKCSAFLMKVSSLDCHNKGCASRLACPIGTDYRYTAEQMQFHMTAFSNSVWGG